MHSDSSLTLLTDLYEITMAYGYWKRGMKDVESVFHLFFRKKPFNGGYAIAAGLEAVIDYINNYRFTTSDLDYLASLKGEDNHTLLEEEFLTYLSKLTLDVDLDSVLEGDVVFPYEPLLRVSGSLIACQLLESPLLALTNFPTLIATKAARVCLGAGSDPVMEFGLRRAQGIDGALTASRASFIGGCAATSNVLAGKRFGIPVKGTMAHSWIMAFGSELEAFKTYAEAMPGNALFLVDTYDTLQGVKHAIEVGKWLKSVGKPFLGIRLDSGDLAYLSIQSRKMLDDAGFKEAKIMASNELEETLIADLKSQGAQIGVWGVGTHLVTGHTQSALDGVYKLSALRQKKGEGEWEYKLKLSEQMAKVTNPGILQVRRFSHPSGYIGDMLYNHTADMGGGSLMFDPFDKTRKRYFGSQTEWRDLLHPIFRKGQQVYKVPSIAFIRDYATSELAKFDRSIKRFNNPHAYPVGIEKELYELKISLVEEIREKIRG